MLHKGYGKRNLNSWYVKYQVQSYSCQKFGHYYLEYRAPKSKVEEKVSYMEDKSQEEGSSLLSYKDYDKRQDNTCILTLVWATICVEDDTCS